MKRVAVLTAAVLCAAAPASIGLIGNASFSEDVPVRVPERAVVLDVHGATPAAARTRTAEPGDDRTDDRTDDTSGRRRHDRATPAATPTSPATDDQGGGRRGADDPATHDAGDDSRHRSGRDGSHSGGSDDRSGSSSGGSGSSSGGSGRSGHDD